MKIIEIFTPDPLYERLPLVKIIRKKKLIINNIVVIVCNEPTVSSVPVKL